MKNIKNIKISQLKQISIIESKDIKKIKECLNQILYVPDIRLKPRIIEELIIYLKSKFSVKGSKIKVFLAYHASNICGFVISEIHPSYLSRNRRSATFGWLHAKNFNVCKLLLENCEIFARENNIKLIRGNINFPKGLGGIGIQEMGFDEQMLYGVPFNDPNSKIIEYLEQLGYHRDVEYVCMEVTHKNWTKGKRLDKNIKIRYLTFEDLFKRKEEINAIARNAFYSIVPDSSGENRFNEVMKIFDQIPLSHYILPDKFDLSNYSDQPEFLEAWMSCNLEKVNSFVHMAFDRKTDELVGIIFCLPDLYQLWLDQPITRVNVDTVMVKKNYNGKGIFSSLNNIGQLTGNMYGITYYEGTGIWMVNKDAIRTVLPHGRINRRFYVWQKRLKNLY